MFVSTTAIVLRVSPFSRTSHIVTWLAADGRQIVTVIKGATRPKSLFLGQYDFCYTCELVFYEHESEGGAHYAKECFPANTRANLRVNWRAAQCAGWFAHLAREVSAHSPPTPELYDLLAETLDFISASETVPPSPVVFARFESKLLDLCGLRPNFSPCPDCAAPAQELTFPFNLAAGSRHCHTHSKRRPNDPVINITPGLVALFDECVRSSSLGSRSTFPYKKNPDTPALLRFLGLFMRLHLDTALTSGRAIALAAMDSTHIEA